MPRSFLGRGGFASYDSCALARSEILPSEILQARAAQDLDWGLLLDRLASLTVSAAGARRLRARELERTSQDALQCMVRTAQCLSLSDEGLAIPQRDFPDLGDLVERLERGAVATGLELWELGQMLESACTLRGFVASQQQARQDLAAWLDVPKSIIQFAERLRTALDNGGALRDEASPELSRTRIRAKQARLDLIAQLKQLMLKYADLLQEQYYAEREGRYVLPVRADAHRMLEGVVVDTSASGNTLFVEPRESWRLSNALRVALAEVAHEEQRLLRDLSSRAQALGPDLRRAETACIEADVLAAVARWAKTCGAVAVLPESEPILDLRSARHPLLADQPTVVANDLALPAGGGLILSGPNAGGKTVTLKCLGLAARMARAGIPLCVAEGSRVGFFSSVYTEIGDSQSIVTSLSSFSAHVLVLASILEQADARSLVLLDEVAGGTDPEQGSALATAYLEALLERHVTLAATTHYDALKRLADSDTRFHNAAVGFDIETMVPTFRVLDGMVGPSTALAVATRFGMPEAVIARANAILPRSTHAREHLLEELASERNAAERARSEAEREASEQRRIRIELEQTRATLRETFQRQLDHEYRELLSKILQARTELEATRNRLRQLPVEPAELAQLERQIDRAAHTVAVGSEVATALHPTRLPERRGHALDVGSLSVGQHVFVASLGTDAQVIELLRNGMVRIRSGNLSLKVATSDLSLDSKRQASTQRNSPKRKARSPQPDPQPVAGSTPLRTEHNTLDLRGERVDEALGHVEQFVDELQRRGEPAGYVLHGHGTGALKQAVREHVRGMRQVVESQAAAREDGGDAFTLLWLDH